MPLSSDEIEAIATAIVPRLIEGVQDTHHDFWIDREEHYNDHRLWREMTSSDVYTFKEIIAMYKLTKNYALKAFLGFLIVGCTALIVLGIGIKH